MSDIKKAEKGSTFPCKQCGATLVFKPGDNVLKCPYCSSENDIDIEEEEIEKAVKELDYNKFLKETENEETLEEKITIKCTSCGASFTFDENITSGSCAFCGRKIVAQKHSVKLIKPKALLPFKIDRKKAAESFINWLKKLHFAPNKLKKIAGIKGLNGVYMPYWTFDAETVSDYYGKKGEYYKEKESYFIKSGNKSVKKTREIKKTRWQNVKGKIKKIFNDVLSIASKSLQNKYIEKLEPWDLNELVPYDDKYLSGFQVESYSIKLAEGFKKAKQRIDSEIDSAIRKDIGGNEQKITAFKTNYNKLKFKHILLPLWISAYRFNNKTYQFIINARTGEVHGDRPYSRIKITLTFVAIAAVIALIILLIKHFGG